MRSLCTYLHLSLCTQNVQERLKKWRYEKKCKQDQKLKKELYFAIISSCMLREWVCMFILLFPLHVQMEFNSLQLARNGLVIKHAYKVAKSLLKRMQRDGARISLDEKNPFPYCYGVERGRETERKLPTNISRSNPYENVLSLWKNTSKFNNLKMFFLLPSRWSHWYEGWA